MYKSISELIFRYIQISSLNNYIMIKFSNFYARLKGITHKEILIITGFIYHKYWAADNEKIHSQY